MDRFAVSTADSSLLQTSHLVEELQAATEGQDIVPVLIDTEVVYFHSFGGGYHVERGVDIVNMVHEVQGTGSPSNKTDGDSFEIHAGDYFFNLDVADTRALESYPEDDYVLSLAVTDYMIGEQTFSEALTASVDKREQEFRPDSQQ